jgi:hypothetical protein
MIRLVLATANHLQDQLTVDVYAINEGQSLILRQLQAAAR